MRTAQAIRRAYESRLASLDLNLSQASVLGFLVDSGPLTQTHLAASLGLGRAATGAIIDVLEKRGLLERRPDPKDRRVWLVVVTDAGVELSRPVLRIDRSLRGDLRTGISRRERQVLAGLLVRLQDNLAVILTGDDNRELGS